MFLRYVEIKNGENEKKKPDRFPLYCVRRRRVLYPLYYYTDTMAAARGFPRVRTAHADNIIIMVQYIRRTNVRKK